MYARLSGASALALLLSLQSAGALTPEEAWEAWQTQGLASSPDFKAANTVREGDTLVVTGITTSNAVPEGPVFSMTMPEVRFRDAGNGTVEVTWPQPMELVAKGLKDTGDKSLVTVSIAQEQAVMVGTGAADAPSYAITADKVTATVEQVINPEGEVQDVTGDVVMTGVTGSYAFAQADAGMGYDQSIKVASTVITARGDTPAAKDAFDVKLTLADLAVNGKSVIIGPELMQAGNMAAALAAGFSFDSTVTSGALDLKAEITDSGVPGHVDAVLTGVQGNVAMDKDRFDYGFGMTGGTVNANGFDMPLPMVTGSFAEVAYRFAFPVAKSDTPQDFSALVKLVDLTMAEDLWNPFDPGAALKRDPVTLIVDLKGKGNWLVDVFDPETRLDGPHMPMNLAALDIGQVLTKAAGAQVAATGGLTFDQSDMDSYGGFPAPVGSVNVTLDGINPLLDALVAIGVVSEDDLIGARFAMASVTKPGANPDQLLSEIEFREGGRLFINGMQMR